MFADPRCFISSPRATFGYLRNKLISRSIYFETKLFHVPSIPGVSALRLCAGSRGQGEHSFSQGKSERIEINSGKSPDPTHRAVHAGLSRPRRPRSGERGRGAGRRALRGSVVPSVLTPCVDTLGGTARPRPPRNLAGTDAGSGDWGRDCVHPWPGNKKVRWAINQD